MILPSHFEDYTRQLMGPSLYEKLIEGLQQDASASIRLNPFKPLKTTQEQDHNAAINSASRVPWYIMFKSRRQCSSARCCDNWCTNLLLCLICVLLLAVRQLLRALRCLREVFYLPTNP